MHIIDADLSVDFIASRWLRRDHRKMAEGVITTKPFLEDTLLDMAGYSIFGKYLKEHENE